MVCNTFEQAKPGMLWGGMKCANCDDKYSAHEQKPRASASSSASSGGQPSWAKRASSSSNSSQKKRPENRHSGTTKGSLAHFVGSALGVKHEGKSSGLMKRTNQAGQDVRSYHANKGANKEMAKAFGQMFMAAASERNLDNKVLKASEVIARDRQLSTSAEAEKARKKVLEEKAKADKLAAEKRAKEEAEEQARRAADRAKREAKLAAAREAKQKEEEEKAAKAKKAAEQEEAKAKAKAAKDEQEAKAKAEATAAASKPTAAAAAATNKKEDKKKEEAAAAPEKAAAAGPLSDAVADALAAVNIHLGGAASKKAAGCEFEAPAGTGVPWSGTKCAKCGEKKSEH